MPPHAAVDTVHYKIFLTGKSGVGKTALAARLTGRNIPATHYETTGRSPRRVAHGAGSSFLTRPLTLLYL